MNKLKLNHICHYLPYGLKFKTTIKNITMYTCWNIIDDMLAVQSDKVDNHNVYLVNGYEQIKPILRPLSQLTQEIEHNGEKFIPAIKIAQLCDNGHNHTDSIIRKYHNLIIITTDKCDDIDIIRINIIENKISSIKRTGDNIMCVTYNKVAQLLDSLHFDWRDNLIDKGLAIELI